MVCEKSTMTDISMMEGCADLTELVQDLKTNMEKNVKTPICGDCSSSNVKIYVQGRSSAVINKYSRLPGSLIFHDEGYSLGFRQGKYVCMDCQNVFDP